MIFLSSIVLTLCGCSIIGHMDQLNVMGEYSRDKNVQHKTVEDVKANYDALVAVINSGKIKDYSNQEAIRRNFGEPIAIKSLDFKGSPHEQWLYRYAIPQKAKNKVYLYFDKQGQLMEHQQVNIEW